VLLATLTVASMEIACLLFERMTALDAIGPYEVLSRLPGAEVRFVAAKPGPQLTDSGSLTLVADYGFADVAQPEIVVVPGGPGTAPLLEDHELLEWIRRVHRTTRWTTSVCTGALLLAAAGVLDGLSATTHWQAMELLRPYGVRPVSKRIVEEGKVITAAGVSAGIDMALRLAHRVAGREIAQAIQLIIEYGPEPPFDAGAPDRVAPEVVSLARSLS